MVLSNKIKFQLFVKMPRIEIVKNVGCSKDGVRKEINKYGEHCFLTDFSKSRRRSGPANPKKEEKTLKLLNINKSCQLEQSKRTQAQEKRT